MSDHRMTELVADITHAVMVRGVGISPVRNITAPDGGPMYVLTLIGRCRCRRDDAELERTMLLRDEDLVNVVAGLIEAAQRTPLGDTLGRRIGQVALAMRERFDDSAGGELIVVCGRCGVGSGPCDCTPGHG